jgi:predicted nuclease of predicted toxin-antitoxin system
LRILFDQNVPVGVRKHLRRAGHEVVTSPDLEWEELKNGVLFKAAEEAHFDLMVTADQNLTYQQNLKGRKIALVVLGSNDWSIVRQQMDTIAATVEAAQVNSYAFVEMPLPPKRPYIRLDE